MGYESSSFCILIDESESQCVAHSLKLIGYILKNSFANSDKKVLLLCTRPSWYTIVQSIGNVIPSFFNSKQSDCTNINNINSKYDYDKFLFSQLKQCFGPDIRELKFSNDLYSRFNDKNLLNGYNNSDNNNNNTDNRKVDNNKDKDKHNVNNKENDKQIEDNQKDNKGNKRKNKNKGSKDNTSNKKNKKQNKENDKKDKDNNDNVNTNVVSNDLHKNKQIQQNRNNSSDMMKRLLIRFVDEQPTKKILDGEILDYSSEQTFNTFWSYILAANETSIHHDVVDYVVVASLSEINLRSSASNFENMNYAAGRLHPFRAVSLLEDQTRDYYNKSISMYSLSLALTLNATKSVVLNKNKNKENNKNNNKENTNSNKENNNKDEENKKDNNEKETTDKDDKSKEDATSKDKDKENKEIQENKEINKNNHIDDNNNKDNNKLLFPRFILLETLPPNPEDADKFIRFISQRFSYTYRLK